MDFSLPFKFPYQKEKKGKSLENASLSYLKTSVPANVS